MWTMWFIYTVNSSDMIRRISSPFYVHGIHVKMPIGSEWRFGKAGEYPWGHRAPWTEWR